MRLLRLLAAFGLVLGPFAVATPVAAGDPCYHGFELPQRTDAAETQIKMMPCAFAPTVVRVEPGTTVTWFNDLETHLLTGANQEWGSRDDVVGPGQTVAYRFDRPGTYPYSCALHRGMTGAIVVGDGVPDALPAGAAPAVVAIRNAASITSSSPSTAVAPAPAAPAPAATAPRATAIAGQPAPAAASTLLTDGRPLAVIAVLAAIAGIGAAFLVRRARHRAPIA